MDNILAIFFLQVYFAAVGSGSSYRCGDCLAIRTPLNDTVVQIVDSCGSCGPSDIILSPQAHRDITQQTEKESEVEWALVPCKQLTQGSLHLRVNAGSNEYYVQLSISNAAQKVTGVGINGQGMKNMAGSGGGRWEWSSTGQRLSSFGESSGAESSSGLAFMLDIESEDGKKVSVQLDQLISQDLSIQI